MTERRLAAIVATDVVGYSRLIGADEEGTRAAMRVLQDELWDPKTAQHKGRVVKTTGDGQLLEFPSVVDAVRCSVEIQQGMAERNARLPEDRRIELRIGVNLGDIIVEGDDIHGDGVNVAARLEALAEPGDICISRTARDQVRDKLEVSFEDLGEIEVKNIARPIRTFRLGFSEYVAEAYTAPAAAATPPPVQPAAPSNRLWQGIAGAAVGIAIAAIYVVTVWQPWVTRVEAANVANMAFPLPDKPSIAVLPFVNLGADPGDELLADGFSADILASLSKFSELFVISSTTTFTYKGKDVTVREIAEDLGVRYVLEGSVQRANDRVRISTQLIDALSGRQIWSGRYERVLSDLFAVKDEVTLNIVTGIGAELAQGERELAIGRDTNSLEAWLLYREGMGLIIRFTPEDNVRARELFGKAVAVDPDFASAHAGMGVADRLDGHVGWVASSDAAFNQALKHFEKALQIDPSNALALGDLAVLHQARGEIDLAVKTAAEAVALNPNDFLAHAILGWNLNAAGRPDEALLEHKAAMRLSPSYPDWILISLGDSHLLSGNLDQAMVAYRAELDRPPNSPFNEAWAHANLALALDASGNEDAARDHVGKAIDVFPSRSTMATMQTIYQSNDPATFKGWMETWRRLGMPE